MSSLNDKFNKLDGKKSQYEGASKYPSKQSMMKPRYEGASNYPIEQSTMCTRCSIRRKEEQLPCGHLFCLRCVNDIKQGTRQCPICGKSTNDAYYSKYMKYKNKYLSLKKDI